jgi:hypothetical protein
MEVRLICLRGLNVRTHVERHLHGRAVTRRSVLFLARRKRLSFPRPVDRALSGVPPGAIHLKFGANDPRVRQRRKTARVHFGF